jgi:hypothetical protein
MKKSALIQLCPVFFASDSTSFHPIPLRPPQVFRDTDVLYEELAANLETPVEFYVYNSDSDEVKFKSFIALWELFASYLTFYCSWYFQVRIAVVMPSDQWGGDGLLGE